MRVRGFLYAVLMAFLPSAAHGSADLTRMRSVHFTGNWGANVTGIRTAVAGLLHSAQPISASAIQVNVLRSSFVDSTGATITDDMALVRLSGVTLGSSALPQAGFWVGRDTVTHNAFIQFRPSLDTSLAGIPGFAGDVTLSVAPDGSTVDTNALSLATGVARDYVVAVLAHGAELIQGASVSLQGPATFDQASIGQLLGAVKATLVSQETEYWDFLKKENVEWIGIGVGMFNEPITDATVRLKYRPAGAVDNSLYTFDDGDLRNFITRAKQLGFKIYLTLSFDAACCINIPPSPVDPTCNTDRYLVNRGFFGKPRVDPSNPLEACTNPAYWWWDPAHPSHAQNVAQFWSTYTQIAVKYAAMCQELGVDVFSLGTETDDLFRTRPSPNWPNDYRKELSQMVAAVRAVYSGLVTYDQLYSVLQYPERVDGGAGNVSLFEDLGLDVVGVSAYFVLSDQPVSRVLSVEELEGTWDTMFRNYLVPLQARNPGKPIVFLEFAYQDDLNAPADIFTHVNAPEPPLDANGLTDGRRQQQNIYQAFFNVDDRYDNLVKGAFLWANGILSTQVDCDQVGYGIHCKPSAQTVASVYGRWKQLFQGLWWNPGESGWGMSVTQHGGIAFNALYTYDAAGQPDWYVMSDCAISGDGCAGAIYKVSGGTSPTSPWNGNGLIVSPVGTGTLVFASDANSGTFNFAIDGVTGSKSISRQLFASGPAAAAVDYTDLWWNPNEPGWGMALTQQSGTIFATWYAYDSSGQARWYVASNCAVSGAGCTGELYQLTGGAELAAPWKTPALIKVGSLTLAFTSQDSGSMTYTINGVSGSRAISRQTF